MPCMTVRASNFTVHRQSITMTFNIESNAAEGDINRDYADQQWL